MIKNIVFLGPPGSGKGTQINELKQRLDLEIISGGDIVRALAKKNKLVKKILERGELVGTDMIIKEISHKLSIVDTKKSIVFDGFPRNLEQAKELDNVLYQKHKRALDTVIYIYLEENEVVKRLTIRKVCEKCNLPLYDLKKCPDCSGKPITRKDDNEATIINRMQVFLENTLPLIDYYRDKKILLQIDGNQKIKAVAKDIKEGLRV